jgi:uncharacterized membrane protein (UPF0127 family)
MTEERKTIDLRKTKFVRVTRAADGLVVAPRVQVAATSLTRLVGLIGRKGVDEGSGLWIVPSSGVHMFFMSFAIDVVGLNRERRIVKLWPQLQPWRMTAVGGGVSSVIEFAAGHIAARGLHIGDALELTAVE